MSVEIILPVSVDGLELLENAIHAIKLNTAREHQLTVVLDGDATEEQLSYAPAVLGAILHHSKWRFATSDSGFNDAIHEALQASEAEFIAVIPVSRFIVDREWFGKLQMPFTKVPTCGMSFAFDSMAGNTLPPFPWNLRREVTGGVFMVCRKTVVNALQEIEFGPTQTDYSGRMAHAMRKLGLTTWACPSVRISTQA